MDWITSLRLLISVWMVLLMSFKYSDSQATECYEHVNAIDYRGKVSTTKSGKTCQKWSSQSPHTHSVITSNPNYYGFGDHNYCRNPRDSNPTAWCYTTDVSVRDEECDVGTPSSSCPTEFWLQGATYVAKEDSTLVVTVNRRGVLNNTDTLTLTYNDVTAKFGAANDYSSPSMTPAETLTFAPYETTKTVTYTFNADDDIEAIETFTLTLAATGTTATNTFATIRSPNIATVYIVDYSSTIEFADERYIVEEGHSLDVLLIRRGPGLPTGSQDAVVTLAATPDGSLDLAVPTKTVSFTDNMVLENKLTVNTMTDALVEDMECYNINIVGGSTTAADAIGSISTTQICIIDATSCICLNGGTCAAGDVCNCRDGFIGDHCETTVSACGICLNDGTCESTGICACADGFDGKHCEFQVSACGICLNDGTCESTGVCACADGFDGKHCEFQVSACSSGCQNNGLCGSDNKCLCPVGFTGSSCETSTSLSACGICLNGGACESTDVCACADGFDGKHCEFQVSGCNPACQNNGVCGSSNACLCPASFTGTSCQTPLPQNACTLCLNGGTCGTNAVCSCSEGFTGDNCEVNIAGLTAITSGVPTRTVDGQLTITTIDGNVAVHSAAFNEPGTPQRTLLVEKLQPLLDQFLGKLMGVMNSIIKSTGPGSIRTQFTVVLAAGSPTTVDDITKALQTLQTMAPVMSGLVIDPDPALMYIQDPEACPAGYCLNGGVCIAGALNTCRCPMGFSGPRCTVQPQEEAKNNNSNKGDLSDASLAGMVIGIVTGVAVILLIALMTFRRIMQSKRQKAIANKTLLNTYQPGTLNRGILFDGRRVITPFFVRN